MEHGGILRSTLLSEKEQYGPSEMLMNEARIQGILENYGYESAEQVQKDYERVRRKK